MGEFVLVLGSNKSGKSRFAEQLVSLTEGKRHYIATMLRSYPANDVQIERHRKQRQGLNFETLELPFGFGDAKIEKDGVVLLEDVANLMANLIFERKQENPPVLDEVRALQERCAMLIAVSISGLDATAYDGETSDYINALNEVNSRLFDHADVVIEMENSVPVLKKGEIPGAFKSILDSHINL